MYDGHSLTLATPQFRGARTRCTRVCSRKNSGDSWGNTPRLRTNTEVPMSYTRRRTSGERASVMKRSARGPPDLATRGLRDVGGKDHHDLPRIHPEVAEDSRANFGTDFVGAGHGARFDAHDEVELVRPIWP